MKSSTFSRVSVRAGATAAASVIALAGFVGHAAAAPVVGSGVVTITKPGGATAGWVSQKVLDTKFSSLPRATQKALANVPRQGVVQPRSASGCNVSVCIMIEGESTTVTQWATQYLNSGSMNCREAFFEYTHNGYTGRYVGPYICPETPDGVFYDSTGPSGYFADGTQLCNTWSDASGRPCEYIEE